MGWASVVPTLEAIAYTGYGFVPASISVALRLVAGVGVGCGGDIGRLHVLDGCHACVHPTLLVYVFLKRTTYCC